MMGRREMMGVGVFGDPMPIIPYPPINVVYVELPEKPKPKKKINGVKLNTEVFRLKTKTKMKKKPKLIMATRGFGEKRVDMEDAFFREFKEMETKSLQFASAALSYLQHEQGHNLELVKPGLYEIGNIPYAVRVHFNFKAKRKDDPGAPVETYFGQLLYRGDSDIDVECCVSVGESDFLPYARNNRGCGYCTKFVHHPLGGCKGIKWG